VPKPLAQVGNVTLLEVIGHQLHGAGLDRATVVLPPWFEDKVDAGALAKRTGVAFEFRIADSGIDGSVRAAVFGATPGSEPVLVVYGDSLLQLDVSALLASHERFFHIGAGATILVHRPSDLREGDSEGRTYHGVLALGKDNRVTEFVGKPKVGDIGRDAWANAAVFVCERDLLARVCAEGASDFSRHVFESGRHLIHGHPIGNGFRIDLGTVSRLLDANMRCARNEILVSGVAPERAPGIRSTRDLAGHQFLDRIEPPVVLGEAVTIGARSHIGPNVVVGDRTEIHDGVTVKHSVLGENCWIETGCHIEGAVLV
jgi:mannose-1-phosphate guanylyltransferase